MVLPGWNVSEPVALAYKLYEIVKALQSAPDGAKAFVLKIKHFGDNLKELQKILESDIASRSDQELEPLRTRVLECKACITRCEEFSERFKKLTEDGRGSMDRAGQAALWISQEKRAASLKEEIDAHIHDLGFALTIRTFGDGRSRQSSQSMSESLGHPLRSGTLFSLPPYSSPQPTWAHSEDLQHAKTPSDYLRLDINHKRETSDTDRLNFQMKTNGIDGNGNFLSDFMSPRLSPNTLPPLTNEAGSSDPDWQRNMESLERRRNTADEAAMSPNGLGMSTAVSESSRPPSQVFTSPTISSRRTSMTGHTSITSRRDSGFSLDSAVLELIMDNLNGVQVSYYKAKSRISYPVATIESFFDKQTGRRYIIISPPTSSNIKLYLVPPTNRIIPHSEHPQAYGSTAKHRVKFIESYLLRSQKTSPERPPSDASSVLSPSLTPVSSAASVASSRTLGSPILSTNGGVLKEESRRQEYDFEKMDDYFRFQELLMGPDVKLRLQVPIHSITAKKYEERKPIEESQLQNLRIWELGGRQTLMIFANLSSNKYRAYRMENFRPVDLKSKTTIRLDVHLPGTVRRSSGSKSPLIIPKQTTQEQAQFGGDTEGSDMTILDYLSIEFSSAKDRTGFLDQARFHGSV